MGTRSSSLTSTEPQPQWAPEAHGVTAPLVPSGSALPSTELMLGEQGAELGSAVAGEGSAGEARDGSMSWLSLPSSLSRGS